MRLIRWTTEASEQLEAAIKRIQQDNPTAARKVTFPSLGRSGELQGTRELVISPYAVVYHSADEMDAILHVWQGSARLALKSKTYTGREEWLAS